MEAFLMIAGLEQFIEKCAFFKPTTGLPHYNRFLEEGKAVIVSMNAEEYIFECMKVHNYYDSMQSYINKVINPSRVKYFKKLMSNSVRVPIPMIDYVRGEQEGRHRMLAYKELVGIFRLETDVPIVIRKIL